MNIRRTPKMFFWLITFIIFLLTTDQVLTTTSNETFGDLIINEFLAANGTGLADEDGDYSDWIEIYNRGNQPINLSGWSLTDDPNRPEKWTFPDTTLESSEYLVVFASGKDRKTAEAPHTNFRLNQAGEFLGLYNILDGQFMDVMSPQFPKQFRDMSYGRLNDGASNVEEALGHGYFATPTPGQPNDETLAYGGLVSTVKFSVARGFYEAPFLLELITTTPDATVYYTMDGSQPTATHGDIYNQPIMIDKTSVVRAVAVRTGFLPSYPATRTYIFLDDILTQGVAPLGFPKTWGTHPEEFKDYSQGSSVIADYEMDPTVVSNPRYGTTIKDDLKSIPSLSLVMNGQDFDDIYSHPRDRGETWERPVSVELIYPEGNREGFQINAGIRIHGGVGRREFIPKHSFRLLFKGQYGATKLEYPFFPDSSVEEFNTLVLRAGADRSFAGTGRVREQTTYTRDEWIRASQIEMSGFGSHGIFVHLYINGLYWGLYNVVERPDAAFMASYFGGDEEDWFVANQDGPLNRDLSARTEVLSELFITIGFAGRKNDDLGNNNSLAVAKYSEIEPYIDTVQFSDYIILNWYAGTKDWPENNWYAGIQLPSGQFKLLVWDGQEILRDGAEIALGKTTSSRLNIVKSIFEILIQNSDFRMEFADRMYKYLYNDGALTDNNAQARWMEINNMIDRAIIGESARWGDVRDDVPITRDDWLKARDDVLAQMEGNADKLITLAREAGYYPPVDPPFFNQEGGVVPFGFKLTMTLPSESEGGTIYYTTDGSDPRAPVTGLVADQARRYTAPVVLTATAQIKARVWSDDTSTESIWSALHETTFKLLERKSQLNITEIMYNPLGGNDYEFIELKNTGDSELALANAQFDEGIRFTFPPGFNPLRSGDFVVLVQNSSAFSERYPDVDMAGTYDGRLSNRGETLTLRDAEGKVVISLTYDDENGWPVSPDGRGDSLVFINPDGDPSDPKNWRASSNLNGSPGRDESR